MQAFPLLGKREHCRERMLRLEKENEKLQAKESEEIKLMKEELSSMAEKKALVESELNWSQRQLMELEAKLVFASLHLNVNH